MSLKLVLNMIVKNEEANISANFDSVKDLVDGIVILDTGSTDNTIQVMKDKAKSLELPIQVFQEDFVNFGISRTRAFELARKALGHSKFKDFSEKKT